MSKASILIICISLKQSSSRRNNVSDEIQRLIQLCPDLSIDFDFFDGIYGKDLAPEYLSFINIAREQAGLCERTLVAGEIGCLLSHLFVWQRLINGEYDQYQRVIIIEDDVYLNTNKINEKLIDILDSKEDFMFLGGHALKSRTRIHGYPSDNQLYFNMLGPSYLYSTACAYSLNKSAATEFLYKLILKPSFVDDWQYLLKYRFKVPHYFCFEQGGEDDSTIGSNRVDFKPTKIMDRLKKNLPKIGKDLLARFKILIVFKRCMSLTQFFSKVGEEGYRNNK